MTATTRIHRPRSTAALALAATLGAAAASPGAQESGHYMVVDLRSGDVSYQQGDPSDYTNAVYKTSKMVFRLIPGGDGYYVAPDELHGCVCLEEGVLIDVFSPHRADFLKK